MNHLEANKAAWRHRKDTRRSLGLCISCPARDTKKTHHLEAKRCERCVCYYAIRAIENRGAGSARIDVTPEDLMALLVAQGNCCAVSGLPIVLGVDAELDHKKPISRGGEHDLKNMQWLNWMVNRGKVDASQEEFIAVCRAVVSHQDKLAATQEPARTRSVN